MVRNMANRRVRRKPGRPWAVTANALLLLLQAGGFIGGAAVFLAPFSPHWPTLPLNAVERSQLASGLVFTLLAVLALSASLGLFRLRAGAWVTAVLVQGINLGLALLLYFQGRPGYVYLMMTYSVIMVLYLHQADVQSAFRQMETEVIVRETDR